jgi:hypothetical protein
MIPNALSVFGQNFNTYAELLSFFLSLLFVTLWLCIRCSAWICGVATGKVPSHFQILFAKSPYLSAPYLLRCSNVVYSVQYLLTSEGFSTRAQLAKMEPDMRITRWKNAGNECSNKRRHWFSAEKSGLCGLIMPSLVRFNIQYVVLYILSVVQALVYFFLGGGG